MSIKFQSRPKSAGVYQRFNDFEEVDDLGVAATRGGFTAEQARKRFPITQQGEYIAADMGVSANTLDAKTLEAMFKQSGIDPKRYTTDATYREKAKETIRRLYPDLPFSKPEPRADVKSRFRPGF